jgi:NADPH:quinone reductase-like Zn-dependent oxidoreductase
MRALVATANQAAPLELREVDDPRPAANEAVIEVKNVSINRGELRLLLTRPAGWRPGQDIAGTVIQQAADGSGPPEGTRVVAMVDQAGWAERTAAPVSRIGELPEGVSFEQAASLPVAGLTALRALRLGGTLLGKKVLVTGASGGVGHFAVQLAEGSGAHVTGTSRQTDLRSIDGPFDLILESVGGESLTHSLRVVGRDGIVVLFGNSSGQESSLSFANFAGHAHARLYAFFVYESGEPPSFGSDLTLLATEIGAGRLKPLVGLEASWRDPLGALEALRERRLEGKAVLRVD